jgi:hypothetical protein
VELAFDERNLLLPGVHDVTMDMVKAHFGRFQSSDRRLTLFAKLSEYVDAVKQAACGESVIIDGSFVMACIDEPEDIDLLLVLPDGWDDGAELKPYQYNLLSKKSIRKRFGFDVFVVAAGSADEAEWIEYFGGVNIKWREKFGWPDDTRKGLLRVRL